MYISFEITEYWNKMIKIENDQIERKILPKIHNSL